MAYTNMGNGGNRNNGAPSLDSTPGENAEYFVCTRGGDPFSANFPAIERESIVDARYYWSGCTFNALLLILLFIVAQILLAIFATNWFISGNSDHCRQILTGSLLSSVYAAPLVLSYNARLGSNIGLEQVGDIEQLPPSRTWSEFWNAWIPSPVASTTIPLSTTIPIASASESAATAAASSASQGPLYGWADAMDFMATGDIAGGNRAPYVVVSDTSPRTYRYHQCSTWATTPNPCDVGSDASQVWSLPTPANMLNNPTMASRRYRCQSHCVPVSQYRNINHPSIPKSMTWGWGVCACKADI